MAEIPVCFLLEKLSIVLAKEVRLLGGMGKEIKDIKAELESIQAFLKDADRMKHRCEGIKTWVNQVRRVAYDVEDVIDEFVLRFGKRNDGGGIKNSLTTLFSATKQLPPGHHLAHSIQAIKGSIAKISERKDRYSIEKMIDAVPSSDADTREWQDHKEADFLGKAQVIGIESKVEELMNQLVAQTGNDRKTFISVYGMPGVGKSTLTRKVYEDLKSKKHFNCFAWLSVSQSFKTKALLKNMLIEFGNIREQNSSKKAQESTLPSKEDMKNMGKADLKDRVKKHLQGKRFVLVLDDVWDKSVWDDINLALPEDFNGSKIIITTRIQSVASELEGTENIDTNTHELKPLGDKAARELLCEKAFPGCAMPSKFEDVCKSMLQRCGGLPLAIVALRGILRQKKTPEEWEMVNNHLSEQVANYKLSSKGTTIRSILKLSYDELPFHLKPCFLYCALFPEEHLIKRNKLIRLWVAEGFIKEKNGETKEKVGEDYFMQLIDRSMLQVEDTNFDGSRVRSCRLHYLMRDLAISISQEEGFSSKLDKQGRKENAFNPRRMSVIGDGKENGLSGIPDLKVLRSLLFFNVHKGSSPDPILYSKLKLLRVLDLEHVGIKELPEAIGQLLLLRYLSLYRNYYLKHLPGSIGSLEMLETLDIRRTEIGELPNGIVRLKQLRHLCMRLETQVPKGISNLSSLQTLIGVTCSTKGIGAEIRMLKELRRLTVSGVKEEDAEELYEAISGLTHLFRLRIQPAPSNLTLPFCKTSLTRHPPPLLRILTLGGLSELPSSLSYFNNLIRLTLGEGSLNEDPFPPLSSIPSLLHLDLRGLNHVEGIKCASGFPKLQRLELSGMKGLKTVTLKEGSMPSVTRLVIKNCPKLKMAPHGIQHLTLQELELHDMPESFIRRLEEGGDDRSKVQHISLIRVFASMN